MVAETLLVGYCPTLEAGKHLVKKKKKKKKKKYGKPHEINREKIIKRI